MYYIVRVAHAQYLDWHWLFVMTSVISVVALVSAVTVIPPSKLRLTIALLAIGVMSLPRWHLRAAGSTASDRPQGRGTRSGPADQPRVAMIPKRPKIDGPSELPEFFSWAAEPTYRERTGSRNRPECVRSVRNRANHIFYIRPVSVAAVIRSKGR
jgi:hypothetical protein